MCVLFSMFPSAFFRRLFLRLLLHEHVTFLTGNIRNFLFLTTNSLSHNNKFHRLPFNEERDVLLIHKSKIKLECFLLISILFLLKQCSFFNTSGRIF